MLLIATAKEETLTQLYLVVLNIYRHRTRITTKADNNIDIIEETIVKLLHSLSLTFLPPPKNQYKLSQNKKSINYDECEAKPMRRRYPNN